MGFVIAFLFSYPSIYSTVTCFLRGKKNLQTAIDTYVQPKTRAENLRCRMRHRGFITIPPIG